AMGNRKHIPISIKKQIVCMSAKIANKNKIAYLLDVSPRTVRRVLRLAHTTGSVVRRPIQSGGPRLLNGLHAAFLEGCIERRPDILLTELRQELWEVHAIVVSGDTIARTLRRRGFTRKKV
ncbi:Homeodomain-like protein, partial [Artomyces pyxidatus]